MFKKGTLWTGILSGCLSQWQHTQAMREGHIDKKDYAVHTTENVTGTVGVMAGLELGAIVGTTFMPGLGTLVGSMAGAVLGNRIGLFIGTWTGNLLFGIRVKLPT